ncbi:MAG: hypothetical protein KDI21_00045 [Halieaceae bacterium]|nr:hypothetical protein [Halieaceae bacterium]
MHRSGTSALCAALAACGVSFGDRLLGAIAGVNDEGFWEDAEVVALNEQLLALSGATWYAPAPGVVDWNDDRFHSARERAAQLLGAGFGDGPVCAAKDPRFCLTLPFWLAVCSDMGLAVQVCVIYRAPLEVARSLLKRDAFPLGYGLRLCSAYRASLVSALPADALQVSYDELLADTAAVMQRLGEALPLDVNPEKLAAGVRPELRHQVSDSPGGAPTERAANNPAGAEREEAIGADYPAGQVMVEFARELVARGLELSRVGAAHSEALATLDQRDADVAALDAEHRRALATIGQRDREIEALSAEHRQALATIDERDEQIREFDRRLAQIGAEHSHALEVIRERDAQLEYLCNLPGLGVVIRLLRKKHAQG